MLLQQRRDDDDDDDDDDEDEADDDDDDDFTCTPFVTEPTHTPDAAAAAKPEAPSVNIGAASYVTVQAVSVDVTVAGTQKAQVQHIKSGDITRTGKRCMNCVFIFVGETAACCY
jgi:hypothetical protein